MKLSLPVALFALLALLAANWAHSSPGSASAGKTADVVSLEAKLAKLQWQGDLDGMVERRVIRALVPYSKTFFYVEKGRSRGVSYDVLSHFEQSLNKKLKSRALRVHVAFIPVGREELIPKLAAGYGDLIFADLTTTPNRQRLVDFSNPMYAGITEIVVTGPSGPVISSVDDLSGKEVFVRKTSSYYEHLKTLNQRFVKEGKAPVKVRIAPEELEAEDILEMVNAGIVRATVVDSYKARMWSRIFKKLRLHEGVKVNEGGVYAFLMRKSSPQLMAEVNDFVHRNAQGTTFGNSVVNRYVKDPEFVKNAVGVDERRRYGQVVDLFRKYSAKYDMDYLLMIAQGFQESRLNHAARSHVGAIGIMQVMPATGKEMKVGSIKKLENNIHAGVKYIRFMVDRYFANEPMTTQDKTLFAFAAYNAGPGRVAQLRREAARRGLDPNKWFHNVELVAADKIGPETVTYVANIYKYYIAYKLLEEQDAERQKARAVAPKA